MRVHEVSIFLDKDELLHPHLNVTPSKNWPAILRINTSTSATDETRLVIYMDVDQLLQFNKSLTASCLSIPIEQIESSEKANEN